MTATLEEFSPAEVRRLLQVGREAGYQSICFGEEERHEGPFVLWRHDIDLELRAALALAEIEAALGVRATFFFMTRSWFYNLFSHQGADTVERIRKLGHRLGLHCHLQLERHAKVTDAEVEERVGCDLAALATYYGGMFERVVSFHNPPHDVLRRSFSTFYSTYQPKFFGQIKYLSDSNARWREGPPHGWMDAGRHPRLTILLHPAIWAYRGSSMPEIMTQYLELCARERREMLARDDVDV